MPINTRTGGYDYAISDLSILTSAGELAFQREYTSLSVNNPSTFSPGWTHNHDTRLIFPTDPGGQAGTILFKAHTANQYLFTINGDGTFSPYPGLCATLVNEQGTYTIKDSGQNTYTFDSAGVLQSFADAQGHAWNYSYSNGKLELIEANGGSVYLDLEYDAQERIESVSDHAGRSVTYHYDFSTGDLTFVDDVLDQTWTYEYDPDLYLLTRVAAPGNVTVERTEYYPDGRAWKQFDGEDNLMVELIYNADGTTTIKDTVDDANPKTHAYDERGTLRIDESDDGGQQEKQYDFNFRPELIIDPLGNPTVMEWSDSGTNLEYIKDALDNETFIFYGDYNNPASIIDPAGYETKYSYNDPNFPTLPTRIEYPLSFDSGVTWIGTDYEYYPPSSGASAGRVKFVTDALGNQMFYTYTSSGQAETVTTAYGTPNALTTTYDYDSLGRMVSVTDERGIVTHNDYDDAGRLTKTIHNIHPTNTTQNYQNKYNIVTEYFYDLRGNQIAVIDTHGIITRTYYDLANRPLTVVQNLTGQTIENETPPGRNTGITDENIRTDTEYDDAGNVIATTDPQGVVTRMYYDSANRPNLTIQNFAGTGAYNPAYPDQNIRTEYFYDANGNVIATKDTLGIITRTYYDALNRPSTIIQNLTGQDISVEPPPDRGSSSNIRTDTYYDANGNVIGTVDPKGVITRTYYDALNRPITVVQNLARTVAEAISNPNPPAAGTSESDIRTDTYYDEAGNVIATVDPRGVVTRTYYDSANRPVTVVNNLVGWDIYLDTPPARGDGLSDENVRTDIAYDQYGRRDFTTDSFGHVTRYEYDEAGQLVKVTANYTNGGSPQNDDNQRNIVTQYEYDALGRQVKTIDTLGRVSLSTHDDLGRVTTFTQNYLQGQPQNYENAGNRFNIVTTYTYDVRGSQIGVTDTANVKTRTYYDAVGRPVTVVRNLGGDIADPTPPVRGTPPNPEANLRTDTIYLGNGNVDYLVDELGKTTDYGYDSLGRMTTVLDPLLHASSFEYNAVGNRTLMTDAEGVSTRYEYDGLNRLKAVVENYRPGFAPDHETNVRTEYTYDAGGNRLSILDGNNHSTVFTYSPFGQVETETDALGNDYVYTYDSMGNRRTMTDANDALTVFEYDELNHLVSINYPNPTADVSFEYDALGRRLSMTDGLGTTSWSYNNLDLPNSITDPFATQVSYEYDEVGNRTLLSYGSQLYAYQYNDVNQLEEVISDQLSVAGYQYDAAGRLKTVTRLNGVSTAYNYYDNGWLQDIFHTSGTETLASYQYQYDNVGNRVQAIENVTLPSATNESPQFDLGSGAALNEGGQFTRSVSFTDPDSTEWQLTIDYGDGTTPTQTTLYAQGTIDLAHVYVEDGTYTLTVTLNDNEGGETSDSMLVIVANVPPMVNAGEDQAVNVNETVSVNATYSDAGIQDTHTATINWGDGNSGPATVTPTGSGSGTVSAQHVYTSTGNFTAEVCVTDSDSGIGCDSLIVNVTEVAAYTVTLQPDGTTGIDASIMSSAATTNYGTAVEMGIGEANNATSRIRRSLIKFDLSAIPSDATITFATLSLWTSTDYSSNNRAIRVYRLKRAFVESEVTWNRAAAGATWQSAGASGVDDRETIDIGSVQILANEPLNTEKQITLTPAMIQEMINGTFTNNGFIIAADTELNDAFMYRTSDYATALQRPKLVIEYTVPNPPPTGDFPSTTVLDDFNRAEGSIGGNWSGWTQNYAIVSNEMIVGSLGSGTDIYWNASSFGADQEAFVTFSHVDTDGWEQDLLLKSQSSNSWGNVLEVLYDATNDVVTIWTSTDGQWNQHGAEIPVTFYDGDQFGARAYADGTVEVYKNGELLDTRDVSSWTYYDDGGYIGLWFINATDAVLDDFGGGAIAGGEGMTGMMTESTSQSTDGVTSLESENPASSPVLEAASDPFHVELHGVDTYWQGIPPGAEQEAVVTFVQLNKAATRQKPQSNGIWEEGTIQVMYDVANGRIQVWKYDMEKGWVQQGEEIFVEFANGDVFSVRTNEAGKVEIYCNGKLLAERTLAAAAPVPAQETGTFQLVSYNRITSDMATPDLPSLILNDVAGLSLLSLPSQQTTSVTIAYDYDPLHRLTEANYSTGAYYHYAYDAVGNRLSQETLLGTTNYVYDDANRLTTVNGVTYTWDNNGNLMSDGVNSYTYDSANRLKTFSNTTTSANYLYNGLNDRLRETVNGVTTTFTMDLNTGLTQALSDGTNHYIYGVGRIAQANTTTEYFLGDALGSVRQLANSSGEITYARTYDPYGVVTQTLGSSQTSYAFTGEAYGDSTQLTYLRTRFYSSGDGRFLTRDTWMGDYNRPLSLNRWGYVEGNPINHNDPSGRTPLQAGYVEGFSTAAGVGDGDIDGVEIVYDYATMTRARFRYTGSVGGLFASIGAAVYLGGITGFGYEPKPLPIGLYSYPDLPYSKLIEKDYSGPFDGWYAGASPIPVVGPKPNLTGGIGHFQSPDGSIKGNFSYLSLGIGLMPFEVVGFHTIYDIDSGSLSGYGGTGIEYYYDTKTRRVNQGKLISDILTGDHSPIPFGMFSDLTTWVGGSRSAQVARALNAANRFEKYYFQPQYGQCRDGQPDLQPLPPLPNPFPDPFHLPTP